jgi:DNA-cytosine methyltransferase
MKLKVLDLFSGIGGFSLGLHSTGGFETTKFVEFEPFCQKILSKNFPNIPIEGDIRNVKGQEFEADVVVGGFPCQPYSVAGKQKGTNDNRYLWPEMFRLIKEVRPEFVIGENVQGIVNIQDGMVLRQVLNDLEGEGFEVQCFLIPASGIGAWHQRYRTWIIGHSKHNGLLAAEKRTRDQETNGGSQKRKEEAIESEGTSGSRNNEDVSDSKSKRTGTDNEGLRSRSSRINGRQGTDRTKEEKRYVSNAIGKLHDGCSSTTRDSDPKQIWLDGNKGWDWQKIRSETERCSEQTSSPETNGTDTKSKRPQGCRLSTDLETESGKESTSNSIKGQQTWWTSVSNVCGVPDAISTELDKTRKDRIKSLGNAIVPGIARILGQTILKVLHESK